MDANAIGWVDWSLLGVLLLSIVVGMFRGFVFEVLAIAGWFVAWFAAQWAGPEIAPHIPVGTPGSMLNTAAAFASAFLVTLIVWGIGVRLVRGLLHATPLRPVDRLLGAAFGLVRGLVVLLLVAAIVGWTPAARSPAWQASVGAAWLAAALHGLAPLLPGSVPRGAEA